MTPANWHPNLLSSKRRGKCHVPYTCNWHFWCSLHKNNITWMPNRHDIPPCSTELRCGHEWTHPESLTLCRLSQRGLKTVRSRRPQGGATKKSLEANRKSIYSNEHAWLYVLFFLFLYPPNAFQAEFASHMLLMEGTASVWVLTPILWAFLEPLGGNRKPAGNIQWLERGNSEATAAD